MKRLLFSRAAVFVSLTIAFAILRNVQLTKQSHHEEYGSRAHSQKLSQVSSKPVFTADGQSDMPSFLGDSDPELTQSFRAAPHQELNEATQHFLDSLDQTQRAAVVRDFDDPFRTRTFCYVLARCQEGNVGLRMSALNSEQKIALNNLLMTSFSGSGYARAIQTRHRDWLTEDTESDRRANPKKNTTVDGSQAAKSTQTLQHSEPDLYVAFFGEPTSVNPWGIRFEGHNLSLNLTFAGEDG